LLRKQQTVEARAAGKFPADAGGMGRGEGRDDPGIRRPHRLLIGSITGGTPPVNWPGNRWISDGAPSVKRLRIGRRRIPPEVGAAPPASVGPRSGARLGRKRGELQLVGPARGVLGGHAAGPTPWV